MRETERVISERAETDANAIRNAMVAVMNTDGGRRLYNWIVDLGNVWEPMAPPDNDTRLAWLGARALALQIIGLAREVCLKNCQLAEAERQAYNAAFDSELREAQIRDTKKGTIDRLIASV